MNLEELADELALQKYPIVMSVGGRDKAYNIDKNAMERQVWKWGFFAGARAALEMAAESVCVIFEGEEDVPQNWAGSARNHVEDRPVIASKQSILDLLK